MTAQDFLCKAPPKLGGSPREARARQGEASIEGPGWFQKGTSPLASLASPPNLGGEFCAKLVTPKSLG